MSNRFTVTLTDKALAVAEKQAAERGWESVDAYLQDVVAEHLMDITFGTPDPDMELNPDFVAEIDRRLDTPRDQWIPWDEEALLAEIHAYREQEMARKKRAAE